MPEIRGLTMPLIMFLAPGLSDFYQFPLTGAEGDCIRDRAIRHGGGVCGTRIADPFMGARIIMHRIRQIGDENVIAKIQIIAIKFYRKMLWRSFAAILQIACAIDNHYKRCISFVEFPYLRPAAIGVGFI